MLLLHFPNCCKRSDIKPDDISWTNKFESFLKTDMCPNFIKADFERRKSHKNHTDEDSDDDIFDGQEEPDWMDLIRPDLYQTLMHRCLLILFMMMGVAGGGGGAAGGRETMTGQNHHMYTLKIMVRNG